MAEKDFFNADELIKTLTESVNENMKTFEDIINIKGALRREIYLYDIECGIGATVDGYIKFWNEYDKTHNIPVEEREPIKIYIDSCGGSMTDTFTIIDAIRMSTTPVITIALGCVYSGGFFAFISADKRLAYPHASFLFHEGSNSTSGTSGQFENSAKFYKKQLEQLKKLVLERTNISEEEYKEIHKDDVWYTVDEGIEKGFVDGLVTEYLI